MNHTHRIFLALLLSAISIVYAAEPDTVSMIYEPQTRDVEPTRIANACPIAVASVSDQRNNKETIGTEYFTLLSGNPIPWISAALENLRAYGYPITKDGSPPAGGIAISAELIRSYVYHGPMRINGMVAVNTNYTLPSGEKINRKYRASGNKMNMAGSTSEYMTTLNYSVNNLLDKMAFDLQELCVKVAPNPGIASTSDRR
ncbi:MAG: hypothetical protein K2X06_14400 [Burkholderiales bacterium]|nr:hypothetical protein [Burkholderiales bacterium]